MTEEQDNEFFSLGANLAIFCIYFHDENRSFRECCKSLSRDEQNALLREIIHCRISIVQRSIENLVNDDDIYETIIEGFYEFLAKGLKLKGSVFTKDKFINSVLDSYRNYDSNQISIDLILKNLQNYGITIKKLDKNEYFSLNFSYLSFQIEECKSFTSEMIEYTFASPEKRKFMISEKKLSTGNYKSSSNKSGCLSVIFIVTCLLFMIFI